MDAASPPSPPVAGADVLGPLALRVDGVDVRVPGARRRALLATLALARGRVVGVDRLVDALWPDDPPDDAAQALYNHVSRLRGDLGAGRRPTRPPGRRLRARPRRGRARRLASPGASSPSWPTSRRAACSPRTARRSALWRGPALEEFRGHPGPRGRGGGPRRAAGCGCRTSWCGPASRSGTTRRWPRPAPRVAADPLRERGVLLLMQALAREGRVGRGDGGRGGVPPPAGRRDRPRPGPGSRAARAGDRRRGGRRGATRRRVPVGPPDRGPALRPAGRPRSRTTTRCCACSPVTGWSP